jgi:CheY-like chemotaxis protein
VKLEKKKSILVVDDSPVIRHTLEKFFSEYGFEIVLCENGLDGIKKAIAYQPFLIFLDLVMPELNGHKMLQLIKSMEELKSVPVIVMSANTNKRNVLSAIQLGADKVIKKPLRKELILKIIAELFGDKFLREFKEGEVISQEEQVGITKQLKKYFHENFIIKENSLRLALKGKNKELLSVIIHEIKGEGSMLGYNELTEISRRAQVELSNENIDWDVVGYYCERIFTFVSKQENINPVLAE